MWPPRPVPLLLFGLLGAPLFAVFVIGGFWAEDLIGARDMLRALATLAQAVRL